MSENEILSELKDGAMILSINRPQTYNALTRSSKLALAQLIRKASQNPEVSCIILRGMGGKAFCSGQDLNDRHIQGGQQNSGDIGSALSEEWNPLILSVNQSPKIVIACIEGVCAGAGISLAFSADLLFASAQSSFVSGFLKIGLSFDASASFCLTQALGRRRVLKFALKNERLLAPELFEKGIINEMCDQPFDKAMEYAQELKNLSPISLSLTKKNLRVAEYASFQSSLDLETKNQSFLGRTKDYQEGISAFMQKRRPQFKGE